MKLILAALLVLLAQASLGQEQITLTASENTTLYRVERLTLNFDDAATAAQDEGVIGIVLLGQNGQRRLCTYGPSTSPTATTLINGLNKADLSSAYANNATTGSLKQRVFHRLAVMGEAAAVCGQALGGTVAGSVP